MAKMAAQLVAVKIDSLKSNLFSNWSDAVAMPQGEGWWESGWFGVFYAQEKNGWIMHEDLGWVYTFPTSNEGFWIWMDSMNWMWSRRDLYPFLFSNEKSSWLFFHGEVGGELLFFDYQDNRWLQPKRPKNL